MVDGCIRGVIVNARTGAGTGRGSPGNVAMGIAARLGVWWRGGPDWGGVGDWRGNGAPGDKERGANRAAPPYGSQRNGFSCGQSQLD